MYLRPSLMEDRKALTLAAIWTCFSLRKLVLSSDGKSYLSLRVFQSTIVVEKNNRSLYENEIKCSISF